MLFNPFQYFGREDLIRALGVGHIVSGLGALVPFVVVVYIVCREAMGTGPGALSDTLEAVGWNSALEIGLVLFGSLGAATFLIAAGIGLRKGARWGALMGTAVAAAGILGAGMYPGLVAWKRVLAILGWAAEIHVLLKAASQARRDSASGH